MSLQGLSRALQSILEDDVVWPYEGDYFLELIRVETVVDRTDDGTNPPTCVHNLNKFNL